ncbi:MAG: TonB-dependent receptor [Pyrinomonadaceae bacterium]|nr:TonB-dependent receptor [Pyrinomonadaceae bacterium]
MTNYHFAIFCRRLVLPINALILLSAFCFTAQAQSQGSSVLGRIVDANAAVVSGVAVTLRQANTNFERTTTTNAEGIFSFNDLPPGKYLLTAIGEGFSPASQELTLAAGERRNAEVTLALGSLVESIIVNASRITGRQEEVERIPGSVDVVDARTLETSRIFTTSEVLRKVAGINVRDEEGFGLRPNIGIRGLNPTRSTKVLLLEDGIPFTYAPYGDNASYYHPPVDRFETIEVLKGSGQILYGPQTVGGVINYITRTPPVRRSGFLTLTGGARDYFNGHISYGGTFRNTGLLFDYTRKQGEGARDNVRSGLNDFNFKSVTAINNRQALTLRFNNYSERSNVTYSGLREDEYRANPRGNVFRNDFFYGDRYGASATHAFVVNSNAVLTTNFYGAYFRRHWWRQSSNSGQRPNLLYNPTTRAGDPDCLSIADLNTTCGNEGRLRKYYFFGVEPRVRLTHNLFGTRNETDFGFRAHFETQDRQQQNGDLPTSRSGAIVENNERRNVAYSGFVQNRLTLGDFTITPGLRIEHVEYQRTNRLANAGLGVSGRTSLTQLVPGLGVSYNPNRRLTVFAGVHRGFAPPRTEDIINNTTGGSIDLDPELSWNYEVGFRSAPATGVNLEATFFRMDYENQIVPASLAGGVGATLTNGGATMHQGLELSGRADTGALLRSPHNFYARAAYTYLPIAKFAGARFSSVSGFGGTSVTDNRLPYAPGNLLTASVGYSHPRGFDGFVEAVYVGRQFSDDLNTINPTPDGQRGLIPGYTAWNATGNYSVERLHTTFFVTIKNLFDNTYIVDRSRGILPSPPRAVQAGLKYRF